MPYTTSVAADPIDLGDELEDLEEPGQHFCFAGCGRRVDEPAGCCSNECEKKCGVAADQAATAMYG